MSGGLLVITSHPDDEVLIAGGTLAACADVGVETGVLCLTRGEQGPISARWLATRSSLASVRVEELKASCAELGVRWLRCYRRQDGSLRWSNASAIVRQIADILERRRPAAVITFGEDGLYYHPDHIATFEFTRRAVQRVDSPPILYRAVWPRALMPDLVSALRARGLPNDLWSLKPEHFGVEPDGNTMRIDVRRFVHRKLRALRCHRTQLGANHAFTALPPDLAEQFLGVEHFAPVDPGVESDDPAAGNGWLERVLTGVVTRG
jgi:N-acetyl-1-D-myo-inositol-2-amino-2-deoxy-alpha-D-glucopyranoside deacetylase